MSQLKLSKYLLLALLLHGTQFVRASDKDGAQRHPGVFVQEPTSMPENIPAPDYQSGYQAPPPYVPPVEEAPPQDGSYDSRPAYQGWDPGVFQGLDRGAPDIQQPLRVGEIVAHGTSLGVVEQFYEGNLVQVRWLILETSSNKPERVVKRSELDRRVRCQRKICENTVVHVSNDVPWADTYGVPEKGLHGQVKFVFDSGDVFVNWDVPPTLKPIVLVGTKFLTVSVDTLDDISIGNQVYVKFQNDEYIGQVLEIYNGENSEYDRALVRTLQKNWEPVQGETKIWHISRLNKAMGQ